MFNIKYHKHVLCEYKKIYGMNEWLLWVEKMDGYQINHAKYFPFALEVMF